MKIILTFITALFLFLNPSSKYQDSESNDPPIRIGATMSDTGAYTTQGSAARNGYLLCQKDINESGGIMNRNIEFLIYDDKSDAELAPVLYEKLILDDEVDLIMGPYGSTLTEAVAPITEKHRMVHISPLAATSSIWEQGRQYLFMVLPPAELFLAGLIDMADDRGLKSIAILQENSLFPRAAGDGAAELAKERGMNVTIHYTYPSGTEDFTHFLKLIETSEVDVLAMAASALDNFITVVQQMKELDINVKMFGTSGAVIQFQEALGEDAEYVYGLSAWEPSLTNPGIDEFVEAYKTEFGLEPSFHAAGAYGSCMIFMEAIRQTQSLESETLRNQLLEMETTTIFGDYKVDERGYQIANKGLFIQWQDGHKVIVWPQDVATEKPRFPMPAWNRR